MVTIGSFEPLLLIESSRVLVFPVMSANLGNYIGQTLRWISWRHVIDKEITLENPAIYYIIVQIEGLRPTIIPHGWVYRKGISATDLQALRRRSQAWGQCSRLLRDAPLY